MWKENEKNTMEGGLYRGKKMGFTNTDAADT